MKLTILLASILITSISQATPVVGDFVRYKMTTSMSGQNQVMEQKIEVMAVDAEQDSITTKITISFNGTSISQATESTSLSEVIETESTIDHCSEMPADMAKIETIYVPAGKFTVCHITVEQNGSKLDQYMGRVLLGLVKSVNFDATMNITTTFELVEIRKN